MSDLQLDGTRTFRVQVLKYDYNQGVLICTDCSEGGKVAVDPFRTGAVECEDQKVVARQMRGKTYVAQDCVQSDHSGVWLPDAFIEDA